MAEPQGIGVIYKVVGRRFREIRTSKGITQADVATETGLTRQSVANIELGRQRFMLHTFFDVARALGVTPAELLPSDGGIEMSVDLQQDLQKVESPTARRFAESILNSKSSKS
jgi:transcriptional regulator with XRE-family HTH domain